MGLFGYMLSNVLTWVLLLPAASVLIVVFWLFINFFSWGDIALVALIAGFLISAVYMSWVTYHDMLVRYEEGKGPLRVVGGGFKDLMMQYIKSVFMPVIPHESFIQQQKDIASRTTPGLK